MQKHLWHNSYHCRKVNLDTKNKKSNLVSVHQWSERPRFKPRSRHTKTLKMVLDVSLLNIQHYKVWIKGKVEQSREGVTPSPTPWCSSI